MKPLIRRSTLTDPPLYYVLTRYRIDGNTVIASTKYDVTDQIEALFPAGSASDEGSLDAAWHRLYGIAGTLAQITKDGYRVEPHPYVWHDLDEVLEEIAARLRATPSPSEPETGK